MLSVSFGGIQRSITTQKNIDYADIDEDIHTGLLFNIGGGSEIFPAAGHARKTSASVRLLYAHMPSVNSCISYEITHGRTFRRRVDFMRITNARISLFSRFFRNNVFAVKAVLTLLDAPSPFTQTYLGELSGLRGYSIRRFTGTRRLLINCEDRIFSDLYFWFIRLGGTVFIDSGTIWDARTPFSSASWHTSAGAGIRLGVPKISRGIIRVDCAYNFDRKTFTFPSVSSGSYFRIMYPIEIGVGNFIHSIMN